METPIIVTNFYDLRNVIKSKKIVKSNNMLDVLTMNITVVPRNGFEEEYYVKEIVLDDINETLPTISEALRVDIFNYYNNMFTNKINRKLVNTISEINMVNNYIKQYRVTISDYTSDRDDVIKESLSSIGFKHVIDNLNLYFSLNDKSIADSLTKFINNYVKLNNINTKEMLPLIFLDKFKVLYTETFIPKNKRLASGETLILKDSSILGIENLNITSETIVIDKNSNKLYILDKTHDGNTSIRVLVSDEIFSDKKFNY